MGEKQGVYSQISILGIPPIANKNAAIAKAAENGGITNISTVDYNTTFLFFLIKYETIVTGNWCCRAVPRELVFFILFLLSVSLIFSGNGTILWTEENEA